MRRGHQALVVTCEHASNAVPPRARAALAPAARLLSTHQAYDAGAAELARLFARELQAPLFLGRATRLAIDLNRSAGHRALFSRFTRALPQAERRALAEELWLPFRAEAFEAIARAARRGQVLHLSVHSFTPRLDGRDRPIDVALLYDPKRAPERAFAARWLAALAALRPDLRLRRNAPYRGDADGHTTALRRRFPAYRYLGLELEVSQRFPLGSPSAWQALQRVLRDSLRHAMRSR